MRLLTALFLLVPHLAAADPISLFEYYNERDYGRLYINERHGGIIEGWMGHGPDEDRLSRLWSPTAGSFKIVGGRMDLSSGPFISSTPTPFGSTDIFAAGGRVDAALVIALPDGSTRDVAFTADLGAWDPLVLSLGNGGVAEVPFFHGTLDPDDAEFFGLPARWLKGTWTVELDHDGSFDSDHQIGMYLFGWMNVYEVPEPSIAVLLLAGLVLRKWRAA
jgi:hypothetical protein